MATKAELIRLARWSRALFDEGNTKTKLFPPHLGGACAIASAFIFNALEQAGYEAAIVSGRGHTFVVCEGWLVDITATQFGQPGIVVRDYEKLKLALKEKRLEAPWWVEERRFLSINEAGLRWSSIEIDEITKATVD